MYIYAHVSIYFSDRDIHLFPTFRFLYVFPLIISIMRQTQICFYLFIYLSINLSFFIVKYHIIFSSSLSHVQCAAISSPCGIAVACGLIVALDSAFCSSSVENGSISVEAFVSVFSSDVSLALRLVLFPLEWIASGGFPVAVCGLDAPVLAIFVSSTSFSFTVEVSGWAARLFLRASLSRIASVSLPLWLATLFLRRLATKLVARLWAM